MYFQLKNYEDIMYKGVSRFQQKIGNFGINNGYFVQKNFTRKIKQRELENNANKIRLEAEGYKVIPCKSGPHKFKVVDKNGKYVRWASTSEG